MRTLCLLTLLLAGCPPSGEKKPPPSTECRKFGDTCEVSPGKLGTCVQRDNCKEGTCLQCQSQH